jgi:hypothetical protein
MYRISRLCGCMSLGFIAKGYGLAAPSARFVRATLLALLDLGWYVLGFVWGVVVWDLMACELNFFVRALWHT